MDNDLEELEKVKGNIRAVEFLEKDTRGTRNPEQEAQIQRMLEFLNKEKRALEIKIFWKLLEGGWKLDE